MTANFACEIGNLQFSAFTYSASGNGDADFPDATQITVTPIEGAMPGLLFTGSVAWSIIAPQGSNNSLNAYLDFDVTGLNGYGIMQVDLTADGFAYGSGQSTQILENVGVDTMKVQWAATDPQDPPVYTSDSASTGWFAGQSTIHVAKHIKVNAGNGEEAGINNIQQQFTATPEPGTFLLLGSALIGLAAARRRSLR